MRALSAVCAVCACLLLGACGTLSKREVDTDREAALRYAQHRDIAAEVESLARPLVERGETPGIVVGVRLPDASTHFFGYGVTDHESKTPLHADTLFPIGSVSKGFLGAITAMLVRDGLLAWDDTLDKLLPPGTRLSADAATITLLELATHTSGLPRQPITLQMLGYFMGYLFTGENFYRHMDDDYAFAYLADFKAPRKREPQYSNIGYGVLGYVVQRRTGLSLDALLEQNLTRPLGLTATGYARETLPGYATRARGHSGDQPKFIRRGEPVPDWHFTELMKGSAGLYSTARDMLAYASAHLTTGTALNAALAETLQPLYPRPLEAPAVAWLVDDIDGRHITYQVGVVAGYTTYVGLDADRKTAIVVLQNSFNWADRIGHRLLTRIAVAHEW
jgi:CubicO group peptidase (beta-lactamase class C family)